MDELLNRAVRTERQLLAADAALAAQVRDARGRPVGRRARRRVRPALAPIPAATRTADVPPAIA